MPDPSAGQSGSVESLCEHSGGRAQTLMPAAD